MTFALENGMTFLILALVLGTYMAWNIGANDVANAMGTSVGSKALTLKQAVLVAAIFEFAGAFLVGTNVSKTVRKGIVDPEAFAANPELFVFGMLAALLAAGVWLQIASYYGWPVSTTHSIVGAIIGVGAVIGGVEAVHWAKVGTIALSWVVSPLLSGVIAFMIFSVIRKLILFNDDPVAAAKRLTPFLLFPVFLVLTLVTIFKGLKNVQALHLSFPQAVVVASLIGVAASLVGAFLVKRAKFDVTPKEKEDGTQESTEEAQTRVVERIFIYLQIVSACFVAFAHGANDVANAIGPLSAVISVVRSGVVGASAEVSPWILALGGCGIVAGLATWGWRVMETIGKKITELTPTRGFAAEFGAATTIVIASKMGIPISTTHTLVGAVLGVGIARGMKALDLAIIRNIVVSWVVTIPAGAGLAILFYYIFRGIF